jgi:plasmid stabilization system protein ParE
MSLRVVFRRAAKDEIENAAAWYEEQSRGLGEEFITEIGDAIEKAAEHPERYPVVFGDRRRTVSRRFPYAVYFRQRQDALVVLAVFHGRRDPAIWRRRT